MASGYCERCGDASGLPHECPPLLPADTERAAQAVRLRQVERDAMLAPDAGSLHAAILRLIEITIDMNNRVTALELRQGAPDAT